MMPFKAVSLLWASIVLLVATSSTCNGVSLRRMLQDDTPFYYTEAVNLGAAELFTVLAYATVTSEGASSIGGYIGVSSGSEVTGESLMEFTYSTANPAPNGGRADATPAAVAKADVTTAYNNAAGRVAHVTTMNAAEVNKGGSNFTAGLYKTTGALEVSSGTMYLDGGLSDVQVAAGELSDGVFIFQMETTFTVSNNLQIKLKGGAQAKNVFWKVGSAAEFGVDTKVVGTVMAEAKVVMGTRAEIVGRLFSNSAAVNLDRNVVTFPN